MNSNVTVLGKRLYLPNLTDFWDLAVILRFQFAIHLPASLGENTDKCMANWEQILIKHSINFEVCKSIYSECYAKRHLISYGGLFTLAPAPPVGISRFGMYQGVGENYLFDI